MSAPPPPGQYVIYSNTGGEKMALTFQGSFKPVTVETLVPNSAQIVGSFCSACVYSLIISYRRLQWKVENGLSTVQQAIIPLNAVVLQASWGTDQHVNVSDTPDSFWLVREADNGYTYVTSTSWPHTPSSFPLLVSRMAVAMLSGVPQAWQARR